jgi:hypothetical protein
MKTHTANYYDTFIEIADDCPVGRGEVPPVKGDNKTVAKMQFEMIIKNPYKYTSDDVLFLVFANKNDLTEAEYEEARKQFFSKGQACLRASPLTKRYGWGLHSNHEGKVALYASDSPEYEKFVNDKSLKVVKAMKAGR